MRSPPVSSTSSSSAEEDSSSSVLRADVCSSPLSSLRLGPLRGTWRQRPRAVSALDFDVTLVATTTAVEDAAPLRLPPTRPMFQLEDLRRGDFARLLPPPLPTTTTTQPATIDVPLELPDATATPQFIAPAHSLKQLFSAPFSREAIALTVHRLGDTLILDSVESIKAESSTSSRLEISDTSVDELECSGEEELEISSSDEYVRGSSSGSGRSSRDERTRSEHRTAMALYWKLLTAEAAVEGGGDDVPSTPSPAGVPPSTDADARFQRMLRWKLEGMELLVGSDFLVVHPSGAGGSAGSAGAARPSGANAPGGLGFLARGAEESHMSTESCLDFWLDSIFASVDGAVVCLHRDGLVAGYQVLRTSDLPHDESGGSTDGSGGFSSEVVMRSGASILRFLQEHCDEDAATYVLSGCGDMLKLHRLADRQRSSRRGGAGGGGGMLFKLSNTLLRAALEDAGAQRGMNSDEAQRSGSGGSGGSVGAGSTSSPCSRSRGAAATRDGSDPDGGVADPRVLFAECFAADLALTAPEERGALPSSTMQQCRRLLLRAESCVDRERRPHLWARIERQCAQVSMHLAAAALGSASAVVGVTGGARFGAVADALQSAARHFSHAILIATRLSKAPSGRAALRRRELTECLLVLGHVERRRGDPFEAHRVGILAGRCGCLDLELDSSESRIGGIGAKRRSPSPAQRRCAMSLLHLLGEAYADVGRGAAASSPRASNCSDFAFGDDSILSTWPAWLPAQPAPEVEVGGDDPERWFKLGVAMHMKAILLVSSMRDQAAANHQPAALQARPEVDGAVGLGACFHALCAHFLSRGRFTKAAQHCDQGVRLFLACGDRPNAASMQLALGRLVIAQARVLGHGNAGEEDALRRALRFFEAASSTLASATARAPRLWQRIQRGIAAIVMALGAHREKRSRSDADTKEAVALFLRALQLYEAHGAAAEVGDALYRLGRLHRVRWQVKMKLAESKDGKAAAAIHGAARRHFALCLQHFDAALLKLSSTTVDAAELHAKTRIELSRTLRQAHPSSAAQCAPRNGGRGAGALSVLVSSDMVRALRRLEQIASSAPKLPTESGSGAGLSRDEDADAERSASLASELQSELLEVLKVTLQQKLASSSRTGQTAAAEELATLRAMYHTALTERTLLSSAALVAKLHSMMSATFILKKGL